MIEADKDIPYSREVLVVSVYNTVNSTILYAEPSLQSGTLFAERTLIIQCERLPLVVYVWVCVCVCVCGGGGDCECVSGLSCGSLGGGH